ncbi:MAG: hypothetical protein HY290_19590 [Planctomycetia bacterium]|nr:hypothetical protein [Planctomycetia bacterium]
MKLLMPCALCALALTSPLSASRLSADPPQEEVVATPDIELTGFGTIPEDAALPLKIPAEMRMIGKLEWHVDYAAAYRAAREERKMLFVFFRDDDHPRIADIYENDVLASSEMTGALEKVVRAAVPLKAMRPFRIPELADRTLLSHDSFKYMYGRQGIAMIDLTDPASELHGQVVSAHPFTPGRHYTARGTKLVLGLPRGTVTQRALIYAVRLHPAAPVSTTDGKCHSYLCKAARDSSQLMASYGSVGHHDWGTRQGDIAARTGRSAMEVAAMSGNRNMIEAAIELVDQWYGSPAHWGIMSAPAAIFGYDLVHDAAGNWWGTGLFAN